MAQLFYKSLEDRLKVHREEQMQTMKNQEMQLEALQSTNQMNKFMDIQKAQQMLQTKRLGEAISQAIEQKAIADGITRYKASIVPDVAFDDSPVETSKINDFFLENLVNIKGAAGMPFFQKAFKQAGIPASDQAKLLNGDKFSLTKIAEFFNSKGLKQGDINNILYAAASKDIRKDMIVDLPAKKKVGRPIGSTKTKTKKRVI